jgi:DnaJ-class molecular chaperone
MRDPYEVLGVSQFASEADIKKAFRTLAKKHHPDTHGNDPKAVKRFQEVSAAYEILGDKDKRAQYDKGEIDAQGQPKGFAGGQGFEGFRPRGNKNQGGFEWAGTGGNFSTDDIFSDILGGFGGGGKRRGGPKRGGDIQLETAVSLHEAAMGGSRRVVMADGRQLEVRIPIGVKQGQQVRLKGQGYPGERGGPPGDALIAISIAEHPYLRRDGRDLKMDLPVTLKEAVLGGRIGVPTLTGEVTLTVPPHSNSGQTLRLKGKGMPSSGNDQPGDLYIRLVVTLPETANQDLESFAKRWDAEYDPRAKLK